MLSKKLQELIDTVINDLWEKKLRVTYQDFERELSKSSSENDEIHIPQQTFSRMVQQFLTRNGILKLKSHQLRGILRDLIEEAFKNGISEKEELKRYTYNFLRTKRIYAPAPGTLDRIIGVCIKEDQQEKRDRRIKTAENIIGREIKSVEFITTFLDSALYKKYPPVYDGKIGIKKMGTEYSIYKEIEENFKKEGIRVGDLLVLNDIHRSKEYIERQHPSDIQRTPKMDAAEHLVKYHAARYQDAIDAVVQCFIKCARLMRFRTTKDYDERANKNSRVFLEKSNIQFQEILKAMKTGSINVLEDYTEFVETVVKTTGYYQEKTGYYQTLATKHKYSRRISRKLATLEFEGLDDQAKALIEVLGEVFQLKRFSQPIRAEVVTQIGFLHVPHEQLLDRRVFEPLVLITLADLIASGRVVVKDSRKYRNIWSDVPLEIQSEVDEQAQIEKMRLELNNQWQKFITYAQIHPEICRDGRINYKRPQSSTSIEGRAKQKKIDEWISSLRITDISEILWAVHELTGILDCFQLVNKSYHGNVLLDDTRRNLALLTVLARGMNIGLKGISKAVDGDYTIGQLTNFDENYVSIENLEAANRLLLHHWDERDFGCKWGDGQSCSSDGKVMFSFVNNLLSRFHYRKGRMGVTIYWFVRNDWIANYVQVIGNDEWESWYVIDGLLNSYCDREVRQSCGDTQAQLLSLWGLGTLLGLDIRARFRDLKGVKLFKSHPHFSIPRLVDVDSINWGLIHQCLGSINRLVKVVSLRLLASKPFVGTWNIYDDNGINIGEGLREVGKVYRTQFILDYLMNKDLQHDIQEGCNRAEFWNNFQDAVFWGRGKVISSNNPYRQCNSALFLMLVMNSIVFYNKVVLGNQIKNELGNIDMTPVFWQYINFIGRFRIS